MPKREWKKTGKHISFRALLSTYPLHTQISYSSSSIPSISLRLAMWSIDLRVGRKKIIVKTQCHSLQESPRLGSTENTKSGVRPHYRLSLSVGNTVVLTPSLGLPGPFRVTVLLPEMRARLRKWKKKVAQRFCRHCQWKCVKWWRKPDRSFKMSTIQSGKVGAGKMHKEELIPRDKWNGKEPMEEII